MRTDGFETALQTVVLGMVVIITVSVMRMENFAAFFLRMDPPKMFGVLAPNLNGSGRDLIYIKVFAVDTIQLFLRKHKITPFVLILT